MIGRLLCWLGWHPYRWNVYPPCPGSPQFLVTRVCTRCGQSSRFRLKQSGRWEAFHGSEGAWCKPSREDQMTCDDLAQVAIAKRDEGRRINRVDRVARRDEIRNGWKHNAVRFREADRDLDLERKQTKRNQGRRGQ